MSLYIKQKMSGRKLFLRCLFNHSSMFKHFIPEEEFYSSYYIEILNFWKMTGQNHPHVGFQPATVWLCTGNCLRNQHRSKKCKYKLFSVIQVFIHCSSFEFGIHSEGIHVAFTLRRLNNCCRYDWFYETAPLFLRLNDSLTL